MPRLSMHPVPKKRFHGGRWRIYWKWNFNQYSIATNHSDLRMVSAALAMDAPIFPEQYQDSPAVRKYLEDRFGKPDVVIESMEDRMDAYTTEINSVYSAEWAATSLPYLRKLNTALGGVEKAAPDQLSAYLADNVVPTTAKDFFRADYLGTLS